MPQRLASLGSAWDGRAVYLIAPKAVAGIHDEGLPSMVVLTHIQASINAKVLDLQDGKQRGTRVASRGVSYLVLWGPTGKKTFLVYSSSLLINPDARSSGKVGERQEWTSTVGQDV